MSIQELDSKGRVVLPKREREKMGIKRRVLVINAGDHIKIVPLPEKPLEALEGALEIKTPFSELRRAAEELAEDEAGRTEKVPLIEDDTVFAFLNSLDGHHEAAKALMRRLDRGEFEAELSSVALVEMELVNISQGARG